MKQLWRSFENTKHTRVGRISDQLLIGRNGHNATYLKLAEAESVIKIGLISIFWAFSSIFTINLGLTRKQSAILSSSYCLDEVLGRRVFEVAKPESVIKIEIGSFFGPLSSIFTKNLGLNREQLLIRAPRGRHIFLIQYYLRMKYFQKNFETVENCQETSKNVLMLLFSHFINPPVTITNLTNPSDHTMVCQIRVFF